jgi:hypothetical protein
VDDEATRAELLAAMASTESVRDLLGASLAAKDQELTSLQSVLQARLSQPGLQHSKMLCCSPQCFARSRARILAFACIDAEPAHCR